MVLLSCLFPQPLGYGTTQLLQIKQIKLQCMQFIKKRQNDPEYLKAVIAQKDIVIEEEKRKFDQVSKQNSRLKLQYEELLRQKNTSQQTASKQIANLNAAIKHLQSEIQMLNHEKNEIEFALNNSKITVQEAERQHSSQIQRLKNEFESQRQLQSIKAESLQKNLGDLKRFYKVQEKIVEDKKKIIEDSNRDLKGFSNQKQERMMIIQNQQYKNEIDYQSKHITIQLEKNKELQSEIRALKLDLDLHKEIENDLIKRSSLAQTLIKKLYKEIQEVKKTSNSQLQSSPQSEREALTSRESSSAEQQEALNKMKFELANLKNQNHYMQSMQKIYTKKYQTLGSLMADYLENLLYSKQPSQNEEVEGASPEVQLNVQELRSKDVKEWTVQESQAIVHLLLTQLKPFLSKQSLVNFPEVKNVNISFVEEAPKEVISLPKIAENYEKSYEKEARKGQNRFKDIPIDISTKIIRSNLRDWGSKVKYGNMPMVNKAKSKSNAQYLDKSFL